MSDPVVTIQNGNIRGVIQTHEDGFNYYSFKGIPFAEPPIGELRFQDPIAKSSWTGTLDCTKYGPTCLQYDFIAKISHYDEDCLHLNVYTRTIGNSNSKIPVMLVVPGGAMILGSNDDFYHGPDYLIRKDIILVVMAYRVGVVGFLDLEDEICPGNQGMKDVLLGMQWTRQNVAAFGGDPDNITVFGLGAGASIVHFLCQSPLTKGLMSRVIFQGSVVHNAWVFNVNPRSHAIKLCSILGADLTDPHEILKFLKAVDNKKLQEAQKELFYQLSTDAVPFSLSLGEKSVNPLVSMPQYAINQPIHIPCLVGHTSAEGLAMLLVTSRKEYMNICDLDFNRIFKYNARKVIEHYGLNEMQVRRLYYNDDKISEDNLEKYVALATDLMFVEGIQRFIRIQSERGSSVTYYYRFSYESPDSISSILCKYNLKGTGHFADVAYLFKPHVFDGTGLINMAKGSRNYKLMEVMTELWCNFVKYGRPTVEKTELIPVHWSPNTDGTLLRYLNIDVDLMMRLDVNIDKKLQSAKDIRV